MTKEERVIQLFDQLHVSLCRYLVCLGASREDAEEITQETFLSLHTELLSGSAIENHRSWIFRVAHNLAVTRFKRGQPLVDADPEELVQLYESRVDPSPSPEELLLRKEKYCRMHDAVLQLTEQQRQCLYLRAEGFRYREIAELLGVSISTVTTSLRRVICKLTRGAHE